MPSPWKSMPMPDEAIPGPQGQYVLLVGKPIVTGDDRYVHLSWKNESYVLRDFVEGKMRTQAADLLLDQLWRAAKERFPCKGRLRRSVSDAAFWREELRRMTDAREE